MTAEPAEVPCAENLSENCVNGDCKAPMGCFLLCSLCHQQYTKPKLLPCLHTFCRQCIDSYTPAHSLAVVCPVCRHQSILPPDGIDSLHDNTYVTQMAGFVDKHQQLSSSTDADFAALTSDGEYGQLSVLKLVRKTVQSSFYMKIFNGSCVSSFLLTVYKVFNVECRHNKCLYKAPLPNISGIVLIYKVRKQTRLLVDIIMD
jgi:hypothetical protein